MLATSTGELVKGIPEKPDPEWVLNRYQRRARYDRSSSGSVSVGLNRSESAEVVPPAVAYQSESELHEDTSPEGVVGRTPSESEMVVGSEWNVDYAWFNNALGEVGGFDDSQLGLDFQQQR